MVAAVMWQLVPLGRVPPVCVVVVILAIGDVCVVAVDVGGADVWLCRCWL